MNIAFLVAQGTYTHVEIALMSYERSAKSTTPNVENVPKLIDSFSGNKHEAASLFFIWLSTLLERNSVQLADLAFIGVNAGPGPSTTLRVVLASINGIGLAAQKPLFGVDGIDAALKEYANDAFETNVYLLNAFAHDAYFGIKHRDGTIQKGYKNITTLLQELARDTQGSLQMFGMGAQHFNKEIITILGDRAVFSAVLIQTCSLQSLGNLALRQWLSDTHSEEAPKIATSQILPLYLKTL